MLAKYWKKIGLFILIVACIFNVITKFVHKTSLKSELESSATYVNQEENKNLDEELEKK
ncbi:MAG: hypothetical protein V8R51_03500 [Clostridia bacterium]